MVIKKNISLKAYNTFGIDVKASRFVSIASLYELKQLLNSEKDFFLISGGSNLLLTRDIERLVVHINIQGISIDHEEENTVDLTVNAGENWHEFVLWCISENYGGLENLSLIPGNVGTSPIQNIGAYGVEVKDCITKVEALEIATNKLVSFSNEACNFGYRNSIFKNEVKGKYILTSVSFRLTTKNHQLTTSYGAIENELAVQKIKIPTLKNISDAIIGSFFKNPVISKKQFLRLQKENPSIPNYPVSETEIKVPAGWLVEQSGFKGKRFGDAGVHEKQALVLVNYGSATGIEIFQLAEKIQQTVFKKFEIALEIEVNVVAS